MGLVLTDPPQSEWFTDTDSALGMSGASVLDDDGCIVGLFWGGGAGGGLAASLPNSERYRYRRVVDTSICRAIATVLCLDSVMVVSVPAKESVS